MTGLQSPRSSISSIFLGSITLILLLEHFSGKHNADIAALVFPDDLEKGRKFKDDKEAMFRR